ncbi:DUF499 domain-containing protein [Bartonella sp. A05]|uniref:DUF499 domain-containing protein n=1 Tax=Bartonella sp. A05 TaxID=2967261 RepID=UPI0022A90070|nr:DUF499 domain-containing protein [Bartonella sp. A05]MCZ2203331.1 DUF499 domain-containing protein [Bartonella sp. A05]
MSKSVRGTVLEVLEISLNTLKPFIEKRLRSAFKTDWPLKVLEKMPNVQRGLNGKINWDNQSLLQVMDRFWGDVFKTVLGKEHRSIIHELIVVCNKVARDEAFSYDDAECVLDSMFCLMDVISAGDEAVQILKARNEIVRIKQTELVRNEERHKTQKLELNIEMPAGLLPWREVVEPYSDVATGEFQQAEFAADLSAVHNGTASSEYCNPIDFFSRTYLTEGLKTLLLNAAKRLSGIGGDPVVELQTNFGGGKTHSMLALYHMASSELASRLANLYQLLQQNNIELPSKINRAIIVGTKRAPQNPFSPKNGVNIYTTWGEIAWQLGGEEAFAMVADNEKTGIAPGSDLLTDLFNRHSPALILIDEWIAYLRQIYKINNLLSGNFDANLTFVQSLTEAVKNCSRTVLVASLPVAEIEVGGEGGQEALRCLKQTFSRIETCWRPATQEEDYEIVRNRLFQDISSNKAHHKENTIKQFVQFYQSNKNNFPQEVERVDYRRKLAKAYPIHPELFNQLYTSWVASERFQRIRGVLRLMAQIIHELWTSGDCSAMIMPGNIAVGSLRVESELCRYLDVNWQSIIATDVYGADSTPFKIDQQAPNLYKYSATQRIAHAVFMATAPSTGYQNHGLDDKQINLGVIQPGENLNLFKDALRRLVNQAKYMHGDNGRYWYSTDPSLNHMAAERAEQIEEALVISHLNTELIVYIKSIPNCFNFRSVQIAPNHSAEIPDDLGGVRMVVLGPSHAHRMNSTQSEAKREAYSMLEMHGAIPRKYKNTLVFLAADYKGLQSIKNAIRFMLAWQGIIRDKDRLDLKQSAETLAKSRVNEATDRVKASIREAWCYLINPFQKNPEAAIELSINRIAVQNNLFEAAGKKLVADEGLYSKLVGNRLNRFLERYIWDKKQHILLKDLWQYLNRYPYLPRLSSDEVLIETVRDALSQKVSGSFAYADYFDETTGQYHGLLFENTSNVAITLDKSSVLVRKDIAEKHFKAMFSPQERYDLSATNGRIKSAMTFLGETIPENDVSIKIEEDVLPTNFSGTVFISSAFLVRDVYKISEGIIDVLRYKSSADITIRLEVHANVPDGIDRSTERNLIENANTLGFQEKKIF